MKLSRDPWKHRWLTLIGGIQVEAETWTLTCFVPSGASAWNKKRKW